MHPAGGGTGQGMTGPCAWAPGARAHGWAVGG